MMIIDTDGSLNIGSCGVWCCAGPGTGYSPLQGSFFTKNSSKAHQPPPTRTITVDLRIRTRRSF